jgi:hypothetical protein
VKQLSVNGRTLAGNLLPLSEVKSGAVIEVELSG